MISIPVEEHALIAELIDRLSLGEEVLITRGNVPVARLVAAPRPSGRRLPGIMKGRLTIEREDDSHLVDFSEYM